MTFKDRCLLVICWLLDSIVFFALLGTGVVFVASFAPAPLDLVLSFGVGAAAVALLAAGPGRAVRVRRNGTSVVIHNLFREMVVDQENIEEVSEGFWASAVLRGGDIAYLVLNRRIRTFIVWRTRVPVHATFRWVDERRQEQAKAELRRLIESPSSATHEVMS